MPALFYTIVRLCLQIIAELFISAESTVVDTAQGCHKHDAAVAVGAVILHICHHLGLGPAVSVASADVP